MSGMSRQSAVATIGALVSTEDVDDLIAAAREQDHQLSQSATRTVENVREQFGTEETVEIINDAAGRREGPIGTDDRAGSTTPSTSTSARSGNPHERVPQRWRGLGLTDVFEIVPVHGDATCVERAGQFAGTAMILADVDVHPTEVQVHEDEFRDKFERIVDQLEFFDCVTAGEADHLQDLATGVLEEWAGDPNSPDVDEGFHTFVDELESIVGDLEVEEGQSDVRAGAFTQIEKKRRLIDPREGDEWPGTWEPFDSPATSLPSFRNGDDVVIRVDTRSDQPSAFVHAGGDVRWEDATIARLHDPLFRYMEEHP